MLLDVCKEQQPGRTCCAAAAHLPSSTNPGLLETSSSKDYMLKEL